MLDIRQYNAHSPRGNQTKWETIYEHSNSVANKAEEFCKHFNYGELGKIAGLLHDIGKYQPSFQLKINGANINVKHSICGAKEVLDILNPYETVPINALNREMLAYVIAGHHSGLPDCGLKDGNTQSTLADRLKQELEDYSIYKKELEIEIPSYNWINNFNSYDNNERIFALSILTRMLYSGLVDADSIETEKFYNCKDRLYNYDTFESLKIKLDNKLQSFPLPAENSINAKRTEITNKCIEKSANSKGIYSLTVPTGGGKTLSSMAFAINHLLKHKLRRIIYVIPYTAIIKQIASEFKQVFGDKNVLEHHSNFSYEDEDKDRDKDETPKSFATENWDAPIVLTTNVQFFESLFSNKRGSSRKIHNITNSVVIFDEAQMLPITLLSPCLKVVDILSRNFGITALLMSATCPDYLPYLCKDATITEINDNFKQHYIDFKRITSVYLGKKTNDELCELLDFSKSNLIIVNSRNHAKKIFQSLPKNCVKFHLSTLMYPMHIEATIKEIKKLLKDKKPCVVVSTQLIECGVDVDFDVVYRSLAGIDSIVQAGGRCNREGKKPDSKVFVFETDNDPTVGDIPIYKNIARLLCQNPKENDIFGLANINKYFSDLLSFKRSEIDDNGILKHFNRLPKPSPFFLKFDFAKCAEKFKYLDDTKEHEIIIPVNDTVKNLIWQIKNKVDLLNAFRRLRQYTVSVYSHEYNNLKKKGKLEILDDDDKISLLKIVDEDYDKDLGLVFDVESDYNTKLLIT